VRVVLDCNVVISAGLSAYPGTCRKSIIKAFDEFEVIITDSIIAEYKLVGSRNKFSKNSHIIFNLIEIIEASSLKIDDKIIDGIVLPDANDVIYLYAAMNSKAKYLITGNAKHFPKETYIPVTVISPRDFLEI